MVKSRKEGYNIQIPRAIFTRVVKYLLRKLSSAKIFRNFRSVKAMKKDFRYVCRPITSDDLR